MLNPDVIYLPVPMGQQMLTASPVITYRVPSGKMAVVEQIALANAGTIPVSAYVSLVPRGSTAGTGNRLLHDVDIPAKSSVSVDINQVLEAGDMLAGHSSIDAVLTLSAGGVEFDWPGDLAGWDAEPLTETWDSVPNTVTWDSWTPQPWIGWDEFSTGKTWDSFPAGVTWDSVIDEGA